MILSKVFSKISSFFKASEFESKNNHKYNNSIIYLNNSCISCPADSKCFYEEDIARYSKGTEDNTLKAVYVDESYEDNQICRSCFYKVSLILFFEEQENVKSDLTDIEATLGHKKVFGIKAANFCLVEKNPMPSHPFFDKFYFKVLNVKPTGELEESEKILLFDEAIDEEFLRNNFVILLSYINMSGNYYINEVISEVKLPDFENPDAIYFDSMTFKVFLGVTFANVVLLTVKIFSFIIKYLKNRKNDKKIV